MAFWGGMGGGPGGGGMGGGPGGWGGGGGGRWNPQIQGRQGLRRSTDAWDDEELGSAYNHTVVLRLLSYVKPYKFRALLSIAGVVGGATLLNYQPAIIANVVDAALEGDTTSVMRNSGLF